MTDPKTGTNVQEANKANKNANALSKQAKQQNSNRALGNWDKHQRVDEEGNELPLMINNPG
ncbi:hypothetical protein [Pedobacter aquatilis]|uniref:hypothetical protein n=1 Tax=Pedobacter aquatilis TaxID=351343 RepID=UPI00292FE995|nr:hypothetical protein [Pedobacter aquatilis]